MANTTNLSVSRDKCFSLHDRGLITDTEMGLSFVELLTQADDDESAIELCKDLPGRFRAALRATLESLAENQFYFRWFYLGDHRTLDELHRDAVRHQQVLLRLAPRIHSALNSAT